MKRDMVKARRVGESLVVTLTKPIAEETRITEGDALLLESFGNGRLLVLKEVPSVSPIQRLELELDILEKKRLSITSEAQYMMWQGNNSMPTAQ